MILIFHLISLSGVHVCTLSWPWVALGLLLPFILGYLLATSIWRPYKDRASQAEKDLAESKNALNILFQQSQSQKEDIDQLEQVVHSQKQQILHLHERLETEAQSMTQLIQESSSQSATSEGGIDADSLKMASKLWGKRITLDDLQLVEGIGPKIADLLADAGISSWRLLGRSSVEALRRILLDAGPRYSLHQPDTWPEQARLAAQGEWQKLKDLQDRLIGGRKV